MPGIRRFRLFSLRGQLAASALAGLITTAVLTALLLLTAATAADVVTAARQVHDRVRIFTELKASSDALERASYREVREPSPATHAAQRSARSQFEQLLVEAGQLPIASAHEREIARQVESQGRWILAHFEHAERWTNMVDSAWKKGGSNAALNEVARVSGPIFVFEDMIRAEVGQGDVKVAAATQRAQWLIRVAVVASFVGLLLAVGFSLLVHFLLFTRLRPGLSRLEAGALAFGAGQLDHRIGLAGCDELSSLSSAFDAMAETLAEKQEALRAIQLDLERAVAEQTKELQLANAELSAADERRRAFMADVSHELRTPLTIIRGEAQVALRTADRQGFDPHDVFERILEQTRDLSRMVNDLFLIARAEAGGLPLDRRMLDLREIASRVVGDFETVVSEMGGSIRVAPGMRVDGFVDPDRLRRALAALIENALRHCQPGVNVVIEVSAEDGSVAIAVCDDGPGISPAQAPHLFERFRRGETRGEGSGLGLSLVSALVEAHGGRASLQPGPQGGTRAIMQFPHLAQEQVAA